MKRIRFILQSAICYLFFVSNLFSGDTGGSAGYFINQGAGANAMGVGRAYTGMGNDAVSIYWNPAGLGFIERNEVSITHIQLFLDTRYDNVTVAFNPIERWGMGLGIINMAAGGIEKRGNNNEPLGEITDTNNALFFTNSYKVFDRLSAGLSLKVINKKIDDLDSTGFDADIGLFGLVMTYPQKINAGIFLQNLLGYGIKKEYAEDKAKMNVRLGIGAKLLDEKFRLSFDYERKGTGGSGIFAGIEAVPMEMLALRLGYDNGNLTAGAGFSYKSLTLDYALLNHSFGLSHRVSFTAAFGKTDIERLQEQEKLEQERKEKEAGQKRKIDLFLREGDDLFALQRFEDAIIEYQKVLTLEPENVPAREKISEAEEKIRTRPRAELLKIAIVDFEAKEPVSQSDAAFVSDAVRSNLVTSKAFKVVDRKNMAQILSEQGIQEAVCTDTDCIIKMGKILDVRALVTGSFGKFLTRYRVMLNLINAETAEIMYSDKTDFDSDSEIDSKITELTDRFINKYRSR